MKRPQRYPAQGHIQKYEHAVDYLNNGQVVNGLTAGAFYMHDEDYKGPQGNNHFRGIIVLHGVNNGNYDPEVISIDRLLRNFG